MDSENEKIRGEHWEDKGAIINFDILKVWKFLKVIKEKIKDMFYEFSK
jgi:hypothetical protein